MEDILSKVINVANLVNAGEFLVMVVILFLLPRPVGREWKHFRQAVRFVMGAFLLLCATNMLTAFVDKRAPKEDACIILMMANFQTLLLATTCITFIKPSDKLQRKFLEKLVIVIILNLIIYLGLNFAPNNWFYIIYGLSVVSYFTLATIYDIVFLRLYKKTKNELESYYDEEADNRLKWVKHTFIICNIIGLMAAFTAIFPTIFFYFLPVYPIFYAYIVTRLIRYQLTAQFLLKAIVSNDERETQETEKEETKEDTLLEEQHEEKEAADIPTYIPNPFKKEGIKPADIIVQFVKEDAPYVATAEEEESEPAEAEEESNAIHLPHTEEESPNNFIDEHSPDEEYVLNAAQQRLAYALEGWVARKEYLHTDVGVNEIAAQLGTSYNDLSAYFANVLGISFRTWRLELRMEEAKRLLIEQPELTVMEIYYMVGYNDRSNFYRHFMRVTGCTPNDYRKQHGM